MSSPLPPISAFTNIHRKRTSTPDINLPSLSSWSSSYGDYNDFSSSPPRSSPPRTPLTSRYAHSYTHIVSASRVDSDIRFRGSSEFSDDLAASWDRPYHPVVHTASSYPTNGHKTISDGEDHFPPSSEYDASENYQEVDSSLPDLDSDHSSNSAAYQSPVFPLDSDEEQEDEGEGYSFGDGGRTNRLRLLCFRSANLPQRYRECQHLPRIWAHGLRRNLCLQPLATALRIHRVLMTLRHHAQRSPCPFPIKVFARRVHRIHYLL